MSQSLEPNTLPALPLPDGVVLPGMVVTISAESDEAKAAAAAAEEGRELLLVPRIGDRFAKVGAVATVESTGVLPGGTAGPRRARHRPGPCSAPAWSAPAPGLWVTAEPVAEAPASDEAKALGAELRATLRRPVRAPRRPAGARHPARASTPTTRAAWPTWSAGGPSCRTERKVELLEAVDVTERVRLVLGWAKEALAERELAEKISHDVRDGLDQQQREHLLRRQMEAIRKELGDEDDGETADDYRDAHRRARGRRRGRRRRARAAQGARPLRAHARAEHGARLDPGLARHRPRPAVDRAHRRRARRRRRPGPRSTPTTPASTR